jgi:hypothetical protein
MAALKKATIKPKQYRGNINLKPLGYKHNWTEHEVSEYQKCADDPIYFIENYVYITTLDYGSQLFKLYPYQKKLIKSIHENRFVIAKIGRQLGKCTKYNTMINIKQKSTGNEYSINIGDFHKWLEFKFIFGELSNETLKNLDCQIVVECVDKIKGNINEQFGEMFPNHKSQICKSN